MSEGAWIGSPACGRFDPVAHRVAGCKGAARSFANPDVRAAARGPLNSPSLAVISKSEATTSSPGAGCRPAPPRHRYSHPGCPRWARSDSSSACSSARLRATGRRVALVGFGDLNASRTAQAARTRWRADTARSVAKASRWWMSGMPALYACTGWVQKTWRRKKLDRGITLQHFPYRNISLARAPRVGWSGAACSVQPTRQAGAVASIRRWARGSYRLGRGSACTILVVRYPDLLQVEGNKAEEHPPIDQSANLSANVTHKKKEG